LIKIIIKEENFKWHLEAFASELFIYIYIYIYIFFIFLRAIHEEPYIDYWHCTKGSLDLKKLYLGNQNWFFYGITAKNK